MQVGSRDGEDPLDKEMTTHYSILAQKYSHGQKSLVGYSPWSHKELDMTEHTRTAKPSTKWNYRLLNKDTQRKNDFTSSLTNLQESNLEKTN